MKFEHYTPCDKLKPFLQSLAISESDTENSYKVIPDINVVMGFQYKGSLSYLNASKDIRLATSGITGLQDSYKVFKNTAAVGTVLVYFKPGAVTAFFSEPVNEIFRQSLSLDNFMLRSELTVLEDKLCEAKSDVKRIQVIEQFLLSRLRPRNPDKLVLSAIALIFEYRGDIRITRLAEKLNTSQSPLEKRFRLTVGATPKKFASIVRFRFLLQQAQPGTMLTSLAYESGFYDQAHFIKEFKSFTGETPERYFKK